MSEPLPRKQSFWDRPGILASRAVVESCISDSVQMATFLAASAPHSGDWLLALPVSSCRLRLSDDAVRVAVSLRLGCSICVAHISSDRQHLSYDGCLEVRDYQNCVWTRLDSKRPDGLTLVTWQEGKPVAWDITVVSTLTQSYLHT